VIIDKSGDQVLKGHLIIFGWEAKLLTILGYIQEREKQCGRSMEKLIISDRGNQIPWDEIGGEKIYRVIGDPTETEVLERAGVKESQNIIILADERERTITDAKSILIVLALKSISHTIHVCVEAVDRNNIASLKLARADHIISIPNLREKLLAQAAITHYVSRIYSELFNLETEQSIFPLYVNHHLTGKTINEASKMLYEKDAILLALWDDKEGKVRINPPRSYVLLEEDTVLVLARHGALDSLHRCHWL
jgi:voltage-gated potassium channel